MNQARIESNPAVMMGKPVIAGTRITVESILERLAQGMLPEDGMREFLATWQMKRDGTLRGMLEVNP